MIKLLLKSLLVFPFIAMASKEPHYMKEGKWDTKFFKNFDQEFEERIKKDNVPGGIYVILNQNKRVHFNSYGVRRKGKKDPIDLNTVFRMASLSKTFSGVLAAQLSQQKKLDLNSTVVSHLPNFRYRKKATSDKLTLEHILSHRTGMLSNAYDQLLHRHRLNFAKITKEFRHLDAVCDPGTCYGYQNILFSLIDPIIEKTQQKPFKQLMEETFFQPLKFKDSSIGVREYDKVVNVAAPHVWNKSIKEWEPVMVQEAYYKTLPAAGINSSAYDLSIWVNAMLGHYPDIIDQETIDLATSELTKTKKEMKRRYWKNYLFDADYGLGWRIYRFGGYDLFYHSGYLEGYRVSISFSKEKDIGFIMLLNAESDSISYLEAEFWRLIHNFPAR